MSQNHTVTLFLGSSQSFDVLSQQNSGDSIKTYPTSRTSLLSPQVLLAGYVKQRLVLFLSAVHLYDLYHILLLLQLFLLSWPQTPSWVFAASSRLGGDEILARKRPKNRQKNDMFSQRKANFVQNAAKLNLAALKVH